MSVKIMGSIWDLDLPHEQAWVLMAYADHADHDGRNCYPGVRLIAYKTGYSERQVQRCTVELLNRGLLIVERTGGGRGNATVYRIDLSKAPLKADRQPGETKGDKMSPFTPGPLEDAQRVTSKPETVTSEPETVTKTSERVTETALKGDIAMSPQPLTVKPLTVIEPSGTARASADPDWSNFCREADTALARAIGVSSITAGWTLAPDGLLTCAIPDQHKFVLATNRPYLSADIGGVAKRHLQRRVVLRLTLAPREKSSCTSSPGCSAVSLPAA